MKKIIFTISSMMIFLFAYTQNGDEAVIRKLEDQQREAFLKKDTALLMKLFAPGVVVNTPTNRVVALNDLMNLMRKGEVDMDFFERVTEKVTFNNNIAIAMGHETVKPSGKMPNAGKTVKRRYTNIWMNNGGNWQIVARQSTILSVE
jgi:hypothetical protein